MNNLRLPEERPLSRVRFEATTRELRRLPRRRRSRWAMTVALAGALVLLSAVAAVGYGLITPQETFVSMGCYDRPSLEGSVSVVNTSDRDPTEVCRELWANGEVGGADDPVPAELTACVLTSGDGAVGVFPAGDDVCDTLGLQALRDVEVTPEDTLVAKLRDRLGEQLPFREPYDDSDQGCFDSAEARDRAERTLEELNAQGWTVVRQGPDADGAQACATMETLDVAGHRIVLGSTPGPQAVETQVIQRLADVTTQRCIGDRNAAREIAEQALRDLGLTDWTVKVSHDNWDANASPDQPEFESFELCASFNISDHTVHVDSVQHERESGWRRFVPGL
jgi:hypothetical protein